MKFEAEVRDFRFKENVKTIGITDFLKMIDRWDIRKFITAKITQDKFRVLPIKTQDLLLGLGFQPIRPTIF